MHHNNDAKSNKNDAKRSLTPVCFKEKKKNASER